MENSSTPRRSEAATDEVGPATPSVTTTSVPIEALFSAPPLTASDFIAEPLLTYKDQVPRESGNYSGTYWYDIIIDEMMVNPIITGSQLAEKLKKTPAWLSTIRSSDAFKARYAQRRKEFEDELKGKLTNKLMKVAELSLDGITSKLEAGVAGIKMDTLVSVADATLERLGYGVKQAAPPSIVNNGQMVVTVTAEELADARRLMRESQAARSAQPLAAIEGSTGRDTAGASLISDKDRVDAIDVTPGAGPADSEAQAA